MEMREKLIELIKSAVGGCATYWAGLIADALIANGVTIPVQCNDCRWRKQGKLCYMISGCGEPVGTGDNFFCQYCERRTEK